MYAITGVTGKVGGESARELLEAQHSVRAVVRDRAKGAPWAERGCEIAVADMNDAEALAAAFAGTEGVFILIPPNFDPAPGFPEIRETISVLRAALDRAQPPKVVVLSTIGAQAKEINLLTQLSMAEQALSSVSMPIAFLRAAWFMENAALDVASARDTGLISSFLQPLAKPVPMVATEDIGRVAAQLLQESWSGRRIVELEGPRRITPEELASAFAKLIGREVKAVAAPRASWEKLFHAQGMKNPEPRIRMLDGFNESWIEFEHGEEGSLKGTVEIEGVLRKLVEQQGN